MNLPHVPFVFFFSSTYYPFIPAIYLVLGSRLFVSFVGKVWTLIQLSIFSSLAWVLVNASVFRVVPGVGITYGSPTCFPRGYNTENSSDYQKLEGKNGGRVLCDTYSAVTHVLAVL